MERVRSSGKGEAERLRHARNTRTSLENHERGPGRWTCMDVDMGVGMAGRLRSRDKGKKIK